MRRGLGSVTLPAQRHGGRIVLSLSVPPEVRDAVRARAAAAGVSMAAYLANAIARPERTYATASAETAQPLTQAGYRIVRALAALEADDHDATRAMLVEAQRILAHALLPLAREHDREVRLSDSAGAWTG